MRSVAHFKHAKFRSTDEGDARQEGRLANHERRDANERAYTDHDEHTSDETFPTPIHGAREQPQDSSIARLPKQTNLGVKFFFEAADSLLQLRLVWQSVLVGPRNRGRNADERGVGGL